MMFGFYMILKSKINLWYFKIVQNIVVIVFFQINNYCKNECLYQYQFNSNFIKQNRGGPGGLDMNVRPVWARGYAGQGVVVTILDDGLETDHPDLKDNYVILSIN